MSRPVPNNNLFDNDAEEARRINQSGVINYMDPEHQEPTPNVQLFGYQQAIPLPNSDIPSDQERYKGWAMIAGAAFLIIAVLVLVLTGFVKLIEFMGVYTILAILILVGLLSGLIWWRKNNPEDTGYNPI